MSHIINSSSFSNPISLAVAKQPTPSLPNRQRLKEAMKSLPPSNGHQMLRKAQRQSVATVLRIQDGSSSSDTTQLRSSGRLYEGPAASRRKASLTARQREARTETERREKMWRDPMRCHAHDRGTLPDLQICSAGCTSVPSNSVVNHKDYEQRVFNLFHNPGYYS